MKDKDFKCIWETEIKKGIIVCSSLCCFSNKQCKAKDENGNIKYANIDSFGH